MATNDDDSGNGDDNNGDDDGGNTENEMIRPQFSCDETAIR